VQKKNHILWFLLSLFIFDAVPFVKPVNPSIRSVKFLFAREEWMTIGTCINADFFRCRASDKCISTGTAGYRCLIIFGMNTVFHDVFSFCHDFYFIVSSQAKVL